MQTALAAAVDCFISLFSSAYGQVAAVLSGRLPVEEAYTWFGQML